MTPGLAERHPLKEKRRANKPLLERKRRARINDSLTDLKTLVLSSLNKDVSKYTKMEKVDILDMTVQFLKGNCFEKPVDEQLSIYRAGYVECTQQIYRSIMSMDGLDHSNKYKILSKISEKLHPDDRHLSPPPSPNGFYQKPSFPNHLRPPPPPVSNTHAHFDGTPATRQYSDVTSVPPISVNDTKHTNNLYNKGHHIQNLNNERIPPFSNMYDVTPEQIDTLMARNSKLYSSDAIDNLAMRNSKLFSSEQLEDIIVRNAKLYSNVQVDDIIARNAKLYSNEQVDDIIARNSTNYSSELVDKELLSRHSKVNPNFSDVHSYSEEQGIVGHNKSNVWRPW